jgi:two-component system, OmpR family, sensor histidine kinase KdpD
VALGVLERKAALAGLLRHIVCLAIVASIVGAYTRLIAVNSTTAALTFLLAVLLIATIWGLAEAITASIAGVLAFNFFFLPPLGAFTVEDPQNWVALFAFLVTAITTSQLSARARRRTLEAQRRRRETEQLYELGRAILLDESFDRILPKAVTDIARIFDVEQAAIYDAGSEKTYRHGTADDEAQLREVAESGVAAHKPEENYSVVPLRLGGRPNGSLSIRGETGATLTLVEAIANLVAIGLERARAIERAASAEAARRNEELRAAMLDGLAHDLKTPLTAIKASVTSLISGYPRTEERKEELLTIVNEETDRLHRIVSEAIQMGRIDAGKVSLQRGPHALHEIVTGALSDLKMSASRLRLDIPDRLPPLYVDFDLIGQAMKQLLDNADRYSPPGSAIAVSARLASDSVVVSVADSGPGVKADEQSRIFDKFYRGMHSSRFREGTGMGLSIAKGIVEAHGGKITVSARPEGGSVFSVQLPLSPEQVKHE